MDKHTFKVGDRVFGQLWIDGEKVPGVFVKMGGYSTQGCIIRRDDGVDGIEKGLYWFAEHHTTHDTDFRVGDWVRYEGAHEIVPERWRDGALSEIYKVSQDYEGDKMARISVDGKKIDVYQDNLVKIQPPQEEKMDIRKKSNGSIIPDVVPTDVPSDGWKYIPEDRSYVVFYPKEHWEPVEEWVKIEVRKNEWATVVKSLGTITVNKKAHDGTIYLSTTGWRPAK